MAWWKKLFGRKHKPVPAMPDLAVMCRTRGVSVEGVVHVGANRGDEIAQYDALGARRVVFVEANPHLAASLHARFADRDDVTIGEFAAADADGETNFHLTSFDQSSSLLKLKRHAEIYPEIVVAETIRVVKRRLDDALAEMGFAEERFDLLALDIQGAELMALRGAPGLLGRVRAVNCALAFEELYEGCALAPEIDAHLAEFGFTRVATATPYHPSWGDGLYLKS
jgi:FkbM family methyltransferase